MDPSLLYADGRSFASWGDFLEQTPQTKKIELFGLSVNGNRCQEQYD
jgi:hypothetical protein